MMSNQRQTPHASSQSNLASGEANYLSNGTETRLKRTTAATPLQHFRQIEKPDKKETGKSLENLTKTASPSPLLKRKGVTSKQEQPKKPVMFERHSAESPFRTKPSTPAASTPSTRAALRNSEAMLKIGTPEIYNAVRFETPKRHLLYHQQNGQEVEKSNLVVAVRIRPHTTKEESSRDILNEHVVVNDNAVNVLTEGGQTHTFTYDHCFSSIHHEKPKQSGDQKKVYENLAQPLLAKAFKGFNTCLFAYGQTGSGKSYSIFGSSSSAVSKEKEVPEAAGIVPRFCYDLFREIEAKKTTGNCSFQIQISYFEIYKEKIQDLLLNPLKAASCSNASLRVREHPQNGPYVVDLSQLAVNSFEEIQSWLLVGNRQRATAATSSNERSSRSHAIFTIILSQNYEEKLDGLSHSIAVHKQSRINFIDLAGSERVASSNSVGERREEGLTINQSLLTLGRVITALAENTFVPYRESVLTFLLKESLGGDSKTVMLATVSPFSGHIEETLSTLRYACQARTIVCSARVCEDPNARIIRELREKIKSLENRVPQSGIQSADSNNSSNKINAMEDEIEKLKVRLIESKRLKDVSWQEKLVDSENKRTQAELRLASYGLSTIEDPKQPCLVNVNQDPSLSGTLFFPLKLGYNWIGSSLNPSELPDIQLNGLMIEEKHCCINNSDGILTLTAQAETYVNGQLISSEIHLHHGDRVILGGSHFFHLHYPTDRHSRSSVKVPDFKTAYEELRKFQEERLKIAVAEAQKKMHFQLISEMEEIRHESALEMSLQRHSYEDEIASLTKVLEERNRDELVHHSPSFPIVSSPESSAWLEIENLLQDTQQRLALPIKNSHESIFEIQSMVNEGNAICRRLQVPFCFSWNYSFMDDLEGLEPGIYVHDRTRHLVMQWTADVMRSKLEVLRDLVEDSSTLPESGFRSDVIFERGQCWRVEDENSVITPLIKEKLEKLQKRHDNSLVVLDDSRNSIASYDLSRRSSLLHRSPSVNSSFITAGACKDLLSSFSFAGDFAQTVCQLCSKLHQLLNHPDRTSSFAVSITGYAHSLMYALSSFVHQKNLNAEIPSEVELDWIEMAKQHCSKLQTCVEFVLQGITLDSTGLFTEWVRHTQQTTTAIQVFICELSVVFCKEVPKIQDLSTSTAFSGCVAAHKRISSMIINSADHVGVKLEKLHDSCSNDSFNSSLSNENRLLIKSCHDTVIQARSLLEHLESTGDSVESDKIIEMGLKNMYSKFHGRMETLLNLKSTIENIFSFVENSDLELRSKQLNLSVNNLETQLMSYAKQMGVVEDELTPLFGDLSYAAGLVHKIVAESKRMTALRRGRDISYDPLPVQLLASRKSNFNSDGTMTESYSSNSFEHELEENKEEHTLFELDSLVLQRALRFDPPPQKSSLKSNTKQQPDCSEFHSKNVRFNVTEEPKFHK